MRWRVRHRKRHTNAMMTVRTAPRRWSDGFDRLVMVGLVSLLAYLPVREARGAFSAFARITPETENKHNIHVQILPVEGQDDKCKIMTPKTDGFQKCYLIVCKGRVLPERQDFRSYLWSEHRDRTDILWVAPLLPFGSYENVHLPYMVAPIPSEVILDKSLMTRSYIHIDYPTPVLDGGYYYCVDLSTYPLPEDWKMTARCSPAEGIGPEPGMIRRDPSDIIRVGDQYYLWYAKGQAIDGHDATILYATSTDGHHHS